MNDKQRQMTGWTLVGLPLFFHTVFEVFWKSALRGLPEPVIDVLCITTMMLGMFVLVRPLVLKPARRYKR